MIYGVGTDLVKIARMQDSLARYGARFAQRILHLNEYNEFVTRVDQANFLAQRFAAKEAAAKALGTGFRHGLSLKHFWVDHDELGRPVLRAELQAHVMFTERAISGAHVSISDDSDYAIAFVVLER